MRGIVHALSSTGEILGTQHFIFSGYPIHTVIDVKASGYPEYIIYKIENKEPVLKPFPYQDTYIMKYDVLNIVIDF